MRTLEEPAVSAGLRGEVVAVVLTHRGRVCLLRRSRAVSSDRGRWHCVTGFLPAGESAEAQAAAEVFEETGLVGVHLEPGPILQLPDPRGGYWRVHSYRCEAARADLTLNWENDAIRWVVPARFADLPIVTWLPRVAAAVGCS